MKKALTLLLAFAALAFSATAQRLEIEPVGIAPNGRFIVTTVFEKPNGETTTRRSSALDTVRAKREVSDFAASISLRIAELDIEKSRLIAEKSQVEAEFSKIIGTTVEDEITEKLAFQFVGEYVFELRGEKKTLKIKRKKDSENVERLQATLDTGEKGTLKIEGAGTATLIKLLTDSKKKVVDVAFTLIEPTLFVCEIDGETIKFEKISEK